MITRHKRNSLSISSPSTVTFHSPILKVHLSPAITSEKLSREEHERLKKLMDERPRKPNQALRRAISMTRNPKRFQKSHQKLTQGKLDATPVPSAKNQVTPSESEADETARTPQGNYMDPKHHERPIGKAPEGKEHEKHHRNIAVFVEVHHDKPESNCQKLVKPSSTEEFRRRIAATPGPRRFQNQRPRPMFKRQDIYDLPQDPGLTEAESTSETDASQEQGLEREHAGKQRAGDSHLLDTKLAADVSRPLPSSQANIMMEEAVRNCRRLQQSNTGIRVNVAASGNTNANSHIIVEHEEHEEPQGISAESQE